jgi:HEAT repeat protein
VSGPADTAVGVRARAGVALARIGFSDLPLVAAHMLADAESPVRQAAADAFAYHGERAAAGAVYLKLEMGDEDELVTFACASALLSLAPEWGLRALRPMLFEGDPFRQELSSLALGAARPEGALEMLFEFLDGTVDPQERAHVLRGLGLNRAERAREYLLQTIKEGEAIEAKAAVAGLGAHAHEPGLSDCVAEAAQATHESTCEPPPLS